MDIALIDLYLLTLPENKLTIYILPTKYKIQRLAVIQFKRNNYIRNLFNSKLKNTKRTVLLF